MTPEETKHLEQRIRDGLNVPRDHPVLVSVYLALDYQFTEAIDTALAPGLTAEDRAYQNGHAGALRELREYLGTQWQKAHEPPGASAQKSVPRSQRTGH